MAEIVPGTEGVAGTPDHAAEIVRWSRIGLTLVLALAAWHAFHDELGYVPLVGDINLAVHEFGHMLFMPFGFAFLGQTMVVLGGSLTQVVFPMIFGAYFLRAKGGRRDVHAATVCAWWVAINLLDVAIYANDARAGQLMLLSGLTGQETDAHDWNWLLTRWGALNQDHVIADMMRRFAVLIVVVTTVVGLVTANGKGQSSGKGKSNGNRK